MCRCTCVKVQVQMPDELIGFVKEAVGARRFSEYVTNAVAERLRVDLLDDLSAELEAEFGPLDPEAVRQARKMWPSYEDDEALPADRA